MLEDAKVAHYWGMWIIARPGAVDLLSPSGDRASMTPNETQTLIMTLAAAADHARLFKPEAAHG